ncbi:MAG: UvrD-helicase domain-containing protein [Allomuricauda sp.]|jgi:DNA helicase-2/ATP-dependent DNA helicase PcrA|uniref:UvrD-helicase domain-containing protein n=1 Tax=Allomuricauda sp. CP2A TaxID=1848189 RepID=UPI000830366F|nr:UvrD-helicase domain-containing protein [Muricauda sp. CP2A]
MVLEIDEKRQAILDCKRNLLVIGGPGCGKTTIALLKAFLYVRDNNLNRGQKVLFLSFSRNAKARIMESASGFSDFKEYGHKLDVQTFHAFFLELIRSYAYLLGTPKKISIVPPHDEAALKGGRKDDDATWIKEKSDMFYGEGKITFDRFAATVLELITRSNRLRTMIACCFPLIIVDEAQDTDAEQWQIVEAFHGISQLFLLGDLDQQIFDYRPDVDPKRLEGIKQSIEPLEIILEFQNYRNPNTEILDFAKDLLYNTPRESSGYKGVTKLVYNPRADRRDMGIRQSVGIMRNTIMKITGEKPKNIAILAPWAKGVKTISVALRQRNIAHRVQFDETATNLSSRLIACLMEPILDSTQHLIWIIQILRDYASAKGARKDHDKYDRWISTIGEGKSPMGKMVPYFKGLISELAQHKLSGNPATDWRFIQQKLLSCEMRPIQDFARQSEFLVAYNRGRIIMRDLGDAWMNNYCYANARGILQNAIVEAQLSSDVIGEEGINVMTTYKSKGKEFDGVIMFQNEHSAPVELRDDNKSFSRSRKLFLVGVTRARYHVFILRQAGYDSAILDSFKLDGLSSS